ncbi:MAG: hypothetical protein WCP68_12420 [Enhydrobacter sp.]
MGAQCGQATEDGFASETREFERGTVFHRGRDRNHARFDEKDFLDPFARIGQHRSLPQVHRSQVRTQNFKILGRECREEEVLEDAGSHFLSSLVFGSLVCHSRTTRRCRLLKRPKVRAKSRKLMLEGEGIGRFTNEQRKRSLKVARLNLQIGQ